MVNESKVTEEKLKGNFIVNISTKLPEPLRIAQFANEPVAFFLHKRRDFLPRLRGKQPPVILEKLKMNKEMERIETSIEE